MGGIVSSCFTLQSPTGILIIFHGELSLPLYKGVEGLQRTHKTSLKTDNLSHNSNKIQNKQPSTLLKPSTQSNLQRSQELCFLFPVEAKHTQPRF